MTGWYGFEGWTNTSSVPYRISYHPSSLLSNDYNNQTGVLSYVTSSEKYEYWLQNHVERYNNYMSILDINNLMLHLSKNSLNLIYCPQAHMFYMDGGPLKEPTNEEIELQTDLALMHNTKGIMYYWFGSWGEWDI